MIDSSTGGGYFARKPPIPTRRRRATPEAVRRPGGVAGAAGREGGSNDVGKNIVEVSDDTFEQEVLRSETPVLVDYWAEWCGPCKMIAPVLEEIASEYEGRLKVAKLNIDDNPATPPKYGIRGIPTLMLFKNGQVEATKVGAVSKSQLAAFLDSNL